MLHRAVGVQKFPGQVCDGLALPGHDHAGALGDHGHLIGLQVLLLGGGDELVRVLGGDHHRHTLLGLGDGQLSAVQALVLLAHRVQVDAQAVGQLADGHGHAAGAEVVAPLDEAGDLSVAEQPLDLPLLGGVALLDLGGHSGQGLLVVALGGAGGPADAVPAGAAAQQDDHVTGGRALPAHVLRRGGAHHRAALQALGDIPWVVHLGHVAGGQADLVAVGGVARRRSGGQLPLGQLSRGGLSQRHPGVAAAGDPHGLVDIHAAGQGVADAAADAGGRAAEGLNLSGVVVSLIFEHQEPVLLFPVHLGGDVDGAGVDLLALVQLGELAPLLQGLGPDGGQVHEGLGPLGGLLLSIDLHPGGQILLIGRLNVQVVDVDAVQMGGEGGVAAVVGPVGVHHPHLGDGGVPLLLVPEVGLEELQVVQIHGQPQGVQQVLEPCLIQAGKSLHYGHRVGGLVLLLQGGGLVHGGLPALHRVNEVAADLVQIALAQRPHQQVHLGGGDEGAVHPRLELDALGTGVGPLVVLPGQGLHRQDAVGGLRDREGLVVHVVHLGLGEDHRLGGLIHLRSDAVGVIPVQDAHPLQGVNPQLLPQLAAQAPGLHVEAGLFFRITAKYTHFFSSLPPGPARAVVSIVLPGIYS